MRSSWQADRLVGWLLPVLALMAEGALLAVIYVAVETAIDQRAPLLGPFELAVAAGVAALAVHRRWIDPDTQPDRFLVLLFGLGAIGWLWSAEVRALVLAGDPLAAIPLHPGGWLMLVAGMRGVGRGRDIDDRALTRLVLIGVPALAVPWIIGQLGSGELRDVFVEQAFVASLSFVTSGFIAAGLARLREIGRETGIDWRRNRSWLATVFGVLLVVLVLGIPASIMLGLPGDAVARGILGPVLTLFGYVFIGFLSLAAVLAALLARTLRSLGLALPDPLDADALPNIDEIRAYTTEDLSEAIAGLAAVWVVVLVLLVVLGRIWLRRRRRRSPSAAREERSFQIPDRSFRARGRRPGRRAATAPVRATDAVTAYLASLDELGRARASDAPQPHETPRSHARRVAAGWELEALQADYALVRYGGRRLSPAEHGRALGRWQRLRRRLRASP